MSHTETPQHFFDRYAHALSGIDLDTLADCYAYPSLAVSRLGRQVIDSPDVTREFFEANSRSYLERGISSVTIGALRAVYDEDGLWVGTAELENHGDSGAVTDVEHNAYQLVAEDGRWRIAVTTPLDAR